ncbi:MAG: ATP-dependent DNA helicase RecG [Patescibacteria group bacterium]|nr:ATP-dependent DNA helicase RecG [Patescibacteria group bacterium]
MIQEENIKIESLPKTSPLTIKKLKSLGINTYFDLINYFPFRYEDYSIVSKIAFLQPEEKITICGKIIDIKQNIARSGLKIQIFIIEDDTGKIEAIFYNQPYLLNLFKKNQIVSISGKVEKYGRKITLAPFEYELGESKIHTGRIIPIYPEKKGLSSKTIREKIKTVLESIIIPEILPEEIINFNDLIAENQAYQQIHFPSSKENLKKARKRLAFDEFFLIQLSSALVKENWKKERVNQQFVFDEKIKEKINFFISRLPFKLTSDQQKVWKEILFDLQKSSPMNRLLQGDVGSGKTIVAGLACYFNFLNGFQTLFMAPTEILAQQHYQTFEKIFSYLPDNEKPKISLLTSSKKIINKKIKEKINSDIVIGTHALISKKNQYQKVSLVIVDEQHRFGVKQRAELKAKGLNPHLLTMTATPIPRTVALTLYGELDFSTILQMPKGRLPIKTFYVPKSKRENCYQWIKNQIKNFKAQVFIVCPLIEESEVETMRSVKAAKKEYQALLKIFSGFRLALLHGKMKSKEKEEIMKNFAQKKFDILVTTPVVEVGVDIPGATIILIEAGERFGLAQLHQLRGRVGRNDKQSYCFLFTEKEDKNIVNRLKLFAKISNGSELAQKDLEIRGPGDIYGTKQHGFVDLKIASFSDFSLIEKTKNAINYFFNHKKLDNFEELKKRLSKFELEKISKD